MASIPPHGCMGGAPLHFNRALAYSAGHTRGDDHTASQSSPPEIKCFSNRNSRFTRQIRCDGLSKAGPCVIVIGKGQDKYCSIGH